MRRSRNLGADICKNVHTYCIHTPYRTERRLCLPGRTGAIVEGGLLACVSGTPPCGSRPARVRIRIFSEGDRSRIYRPFLSVKTSHRVPLRTDCKCVHAPYVCEESCRHTYWGSLHVKHLPGKANYSARCTTFSRPERGPTNAAAMEERGGEGA